MIAFVDFEDRMGSSTRAPTKHTHAGAVVRAASDASVYLASLFGQSAVDQRDVHLENLPVMELIR